VLIHGFAEITNPVMIFSFSDSAEAHLLSGASPG
jgi:hypothetical protein